MNSSSPKDSLYETVPQKYVGIYGTLKFLQSIEVRVLIFIYRKWFEFNFFIPWLLKVLNIPDDIPTICSMLISAQGTTQSRINWRNR